MRLLPLLVLFLALACARSTTISGEVYVLTEGRETVRLGGSRIFVYDLSEVRSHLIGVPGGATPLDQMKGLRELAAVDADSEGRFTVTLPKGEYAIGAIEHRQAGDRKEFYQWLVPAKPNVTLSNNNLPGEGDSLLR